MIAYIAPGDMGTGDYFGTATYANGACSATAVFYISDSDNLNYRSFPLKRVPQINIEEYYKKYPHRVPNVYPDAPNKLKFTSNHVVKQEHIIKQPISKSGFKRGQRE